jgi:hypothetical protein
MSTEWNNKLALSLREPADGALDLLQVASIRAALLPDDAATDLADADPRHAWLSSATDRVPQALLAQATPAAHGWAATCEVTHPLSPERRSFGELDLATLRAKASALASEAAARFDDTRRRWLWLWRFLADRVAAEVGPGAPVVHLLPADPRSPDLSVWGRMAIDGAIATATPSPAFFVAHVEPTIFDAANPPPDASFVASLRLQAHLAWQAALVVIEALGPDAVLAPSLRHHPLCDAWLAQQKVTANKGDKAAAAPSFACFPSSFTAIVPLARASDLGQACADRVREAWKSIAGEAMSKLADLGADTKDETFLSLWKRQVEDAWNPGWVAVPWLDDSNGAGSLVSKPDVAAHEKWVKAHQDAQGLEDPWVGAYFGLWYTAALAASDGRRYRLAPVRTVQAGPTCTSCGQRQALYTGAGADRLTSATDLWSRVAAVGGHVVAEGELLCACCATARLWAGDVEPPAPGAVVVFALDQIAAMRRGGKDAKQAAAMGSLLHSLAGEPAAKARGALKEILDTPSLLGPSRLASVEAACTTVAMHTIPALVRDAGGTMIHATSEEQMALVPRHRVLGLVQAVRDRLRDGFVEVDGRAAVQLGSSTTVSAVVVLPEHGVPLGRAVRAARSLLTGLARDGLGAEALVLARHAVDGSQQVLGLRGGEPQSLLQPLLAAFPTTATFDKLVAALRPIRAALVDADVDKALPDARMMLVGDAIERAGIQLDGAADDTVRALCAVVDRALAQADGDVRRAMDGLQVAARLAGGDR